MTSNFRLEEAIVNNAYWSLPTEFQFYLLFPVLLVMHRLFPILPMVLFCGALYVITIIFELDEFNTTGMLWEFAGGMICGHWLVTRPLHLPWQLSLVLLLGLYGLAQIAQRDLLPYIPGLYVDLYLGMIAIAIVFVCAQTELPKFNNGFVRFLNWQGEVSYSIYLFHNLYVALWLLIALHWQLVGFERLWFITLGTVICTYMTSHFTYQWIEKPGMEWGKRYVAKRKAMQGKTNPAKV